MWQLISENSGLRIAMLLGLFVLVTIVAYLVASSVAVRQATRQRLAGASSAGTPVGVTTQSLRKEESDGAWIKLVNAIEKTGIPLTDTKKDEVRQKLIAAGFTSPVAPRVYTLVRLALVIGLPLWVLLMMWMAGSSPGPFKLYRNLVIAALAGLYLPSVYIRAKADRRQREIINAFPDAIDLMLVCVEAGLGLEAAFSRVGQEMVKSHPLLAEQLGAVVLELRAGRSREDALRRMADRAGSDEIRAFATLLIQSTKLGSSVATTLRIYAAEMREKRRMRAEEKAHRLPVLLSIPLVTCMLPVMIGVLMLPAMIRVFRTLIPGMAGEG